MKANKILKRTLIILVIILLSIISFAGIYVKDKNQISNLVKDYKIGMDLEGTRRVELDVSDSTETINYDAEGNVIDSSDTETEVAKKEEKAVNDESVLTLENYNNVKKIIENRLKIMGVTDYEIKLNEENGMIILNLPENENTDVIVAQMQYQGKFEIIDKDTNEVLMTNDDLKSVKAGYGTSSSGYTTIFVNFQFDKEGTQKFKDITNTYIETTVTEENSEETNNQEETSEEATNQEESTVTKEIVIKVDGSELLTTHFDKEVSNGLLQLSVGSSNSSTTAEDLQNNLTSANNMAALLDSGKMPIVYEVAQNKYVASEIESDNIELFISLSIIVATIGMIYFIIKYKEKGIFSSIALIGYIAVLLLVLRYTNVTITVTGLVAIVLSTVLTYIAMIKILKYNLKVDNKKEAFNRAMIKNTLILVPVLVVSIIFTFNSWLPVFSFGMVMFWGIIINLLYNLVITRNMIIDSKN